MSIPYTKKFQPGDKRDNGSYPLSIAHGGKHVLKELWLIKFVKRNGGLIGAQKSCHDICRAAYKSQYLRDHIVTVQKT